MVISVPFWCGLAMHFPIPARGGIMSNLKMEVRMRGKKVVIPRTETREGLTHDPDDDRCVSLIPLRVFLVGASPMALWTLGILMLSLHVSDKGIVILPTSQYRAVPSVSRMPTSEDGCWPKVGVDGRTLTVVCRSLDGTFREVNPVRFSELRLKHSDTECQEDAEKWRRMATDCMNADGIPVEKEMRRPATCADRDHLRDQAENLCSIEVTEL